MRGRIGPLERKSLGTVSGNDADLVGWLSGRGDSLRLSGAPVDEAPVRLPPH